MSPCVRGPFASAGSHPDDPERAITADIMFEVHDYGDVQLELMLVGDGGPLTVLLPGAGGGVRGYRALAPLLVDAGLRVVGVNPRGSGASSGEMHGLTLHELANDVAHVVEEFGGPAVVMGHGGGNRIARMLASDRPELVRAVVLLAAGGRVPPDPAAADAVTKMYEATLPEEELRPLRQLALFSPSSEMRDDFPPPDQSPATAAMILAAGAATDLSEWWAGGSAPMLVVQGADDRAAPPQNGHQLAGEYPDRVTVVDVPRAGHAMMIEQPGAVAEAVAGFLRAQGVLVRN